MISFLSFKLTGFASEIVTIFIAFTVYGGDINVYYGNVVSIQNLSNFTPTEVC